MKGFIKSIPVKKVTEGMQVIYKNQIINLIGDMLSNTDLLKACKTLVVEYIEVPSNAKPGIRELIKVVQLPLKYSQWQVDKIDTEVEFEVAYVNENKSEFSNNGMQIAKIILKEKRMYSEEEITAYLKKELSQYGCKRDIAGKWILEDNLWHVLRLIEQNVK